MNSIHAKPLLRGTSHLIAAVASVFWGALIIYQAPGDLHTRAALIYMASLIILFATSAFYHVPTWSPQIRKWLRRADHSAIFIMIAGSYTPLIMICFPSDKMTLFLSIVWIGAAVGILKSLFWVSAPRLILALLCIALGWVALIEWNVFIQKLYFGEVALLLIGGLCYTIGALIYAFKRPDPFPRVFGYHEVFHLFTIIAAVVHGVVFYRIIVQL